MKHKITALLLCAALSAASLSGCAAGKQEAAPGEKQPQTPSPSVTVEQATTEQVQAALSEEGAVVLDARPSDAYNGWQLDGAARSGHIKGADSFSADLLRCEYDDKKNLEGESRDQVLQGYLEDKNLTPDTPVIVYDTNGSDATAVAQYLLSHGIKNVSTYDANEWLSDDALELETYPNYHLLLPPSVVKDITEQKVPEGFTDGKKIVIVDVSWGDEKASGYQDGHVPGAVHINTDSFEPPKVYTGGREQWRLADDNTLLELLLANGITSEDCVIVTGPEPMASSRFAVICQYLGVKDVRVMNGGLTTWRLAGYSLETGVNQPQKADDFGAAIPAQPDLIDTLDEIKPLLARDDFTLVDNRTWEEFIGESTGYSYHDLAGRIEGAVFGYAGKKNSSSMSYYRSLDKTMRSARDILAMWEKCGIDPQKHLSFMCGSGWRAAEVLWYAQVMGLSDVSLFSDGWIGWSTEGNPYLTQDPTKG